MSLWGLWSATLRTTGVYDIPNPATQGIFQWQSRYPTVYPLFSFVSVWFGSIIRRLTIYKYGEIFCANTLTLARFLLALYVAVICVHTPSLMVGCVSRLNMVSWFSFLWNQRTFPFSISKWYCPSLCFEWLPTVSNIDCMPLLVSSLTHVDIVMPSLGILLKCAPSRRTSPPWNIKWCWNPKFNNGLTMFVNVNLAAALL